MAGDMTITPLTELVAAEVVELSINDYLIDAPYCCAKGNKQQDAKSEDSRRK